MCLHSWRHNIHTARNSFTMYYFLHLLPCADKGIRIWVQWAETTYLTLKFKPADLAVPSVHFCLHTHAHTHWLAPPLLFSQCSHWIYRRSSKNRKLVCSGRCYYCGTLLQINYCIVNVSCVSSIAAVCKLYLVYLLQNVNTLEILKMLSSAKTNTNSTKPPWINNS